MHLIFTAIDTKDQFRKFSWWFTNIETICDVLNTVVARGSQLIQAEIIDNNQRMELPVDAFDGMICSAAFLQLEQEWQQILCTPPSFNSLRYRQAVKRTYPGAAPFGDQ